MPTLTKIRLLGGPCDPRHLEMVVTVDAVSVGIRPMPFDCIDVYVVTDRFVDDGVVLIATGEYAYTTGTRPQRDKYRRALTRLGTGRAFMIKPERRDAH